MDDSSVLQLQQALQAGDAPAFVAAVGAALRQSKAAFPALRQGIRQLLEEAS